MTKRTARVVPDYTGECNTHEIGGVIRRDASDPSLWSFIDNTTHENCGFSHAEIVNGGYGLKLYYDTTDVVYGNCQSVISFGADADETLASDYQFTAGPSVGLSNCVIEAKMTTAGGSHVMVKFDDPSIPFHQGNIWLRGEFRSKHAGYIEPTLDPDAAAFLAYYTDPVLVNDRARRAINRTILKLKRKNLWNKLGSFNPLCGPTEDFALRDMRDPMRSATNHGATWLQNIGFLGNGSGAYIATGIIPTAVGASRNDITIGAWVYDGLDDGKYVVGEDGSAGSPVCLMYAKTGSGKTSGRLCSSGGSIAVGDSKGHTGIIAMSRDSSSGFKMYYEGLQIGSEAVSSSTNDPDRELTLLRSQNGYTSDTISASFVGKNFTAQNHIDIRNILREHFTMIS